MIDDNDKPKTIRIALNVAYPSISVRLNETKYKIKWAIITFFTVV